MEGGKNKNVVVHRFRCHNDPPPPYTHKKKKEKKISPKNTLCFLKLCCDVLHGVYDTEFTMTHAVNFPDQPPCLPVYHGLHFVVMFLLIIRKTLYHYHLSLTDCNEQIHMTKNIYGLLRYLYYITRLLTLSLPKLTVLIWRDQLPVLIFVDVPIFQKV